MYRGGLIGPGEKWRHLRTRSRSARSGISPEPIRKLAETPLRGSFVRLPDHKLSGLFRPGPPRLPTLPPSLQPLREKPRGGSWASATSCWCSRFVSSEKKFPWTVGKSFARISWLHRATFEPGKLARDPPSQVSSVSDDCDREGKKIARVLIRFLFDLQISLSCLFACSER